MPPVMVGQIARNNLREPEWSSGLLALPVNIKHKYMFHALSGALTLALTIVVLKLFLPEIAAGLIELIVKVIHIAIVAVDQTSVNLPH